VFKGLLKFCLNIRLLSSYKQNLTLQQVAYYLDPLYIHVSN